MNKTWLIIKREFLTRVKKKSFIIMTLLGPILFVGLMALAVFLSQQEKGTTEVLIADTNGQFAVLDTSLVKDSKSVKFYFNGTDISDEAFEASPYDVLVRLEDADDIRNKTLPLIYKESEPSALSQNKISNELEKVYQELIMINNEMSKEQIESLTARVDLQPQKIFEAAKDIPTEVGAIVGFFMSVIIYMFLFIYGAQIMRSVMEEKTSRIVEVIVSSVKPFQLMMGKIVGVAMVGLTQFLIWIIFSNVLFFVFAIIFPDIFSGSGQIEAAQDMMTEVDTNAFASKFWKVFHQINFPFMIGMFLFYFLGGYLLYSSLFAAIGSAVDHESDTQQFMIPIMMPMIFGFIIAEMAILNPDGPAVYWTSIIPFTSPVVMMVKVGMMGMGSIPIDWGTLLLSMGLLILGFFFTTWLAGKIYRTGILMHGKKVSYKELWKWLTYKV